MAWEPGNELKVDDDPKVFVDFMLAVANELRALAPNQLVTTGMISTQHADMDPDDANRHAERLRLLGSPAFDFITVHSYNGVNEHKEESRCPPGAVAQPAQTSHRRGSRLRRQARRRKKRPHATRFPLIPAASTAARRDCVNADMNKWFDLLAGARLHAVGIHGRLRQRGWRRILRHGLGDPRQGRLGRAI